MNSEKILPLAAVSTLIITLLAFSAAVRAQSDAGQKDVERLKQLSNTARAHFFDGLTALKNNQRTLARENFDKSVETLLLSGMQEQPLFRDCYGQLTETIYRMEFPSAEKAPNIAYLAETCGWNVSDNRQQTSAEFEEASLNLNSALTKNPAGFTEQKFEPSPLDELAKLELTEEEKQVETNPVAFQQYQLIEVAATSKSLGFNFQMHPMIQQFINYYRGRGKKTMETGLYRSGMFMRMARRIFREEGIPENVAWLGQVESAWKPTAQSRAAAAGLWQFIPSTGARFGLLQNRYLDERNSFEKATRASARYLKFLANRYNGNWELAMAAYNSGEGNVDRAVRRAGVVSFWVAYPYLPQETRNYVPNILATIMIANNPNAYGFGDVRPAPPLAYDLVRVPAATNLFLVAQASGTTIEYIRYLNPELRSNMTPPEPYVIRIPAGKLTEISAVQQKVGKVKNN
jgi:hypothetical protein